MQQQKPWNGPPPTSHAVTRVGVVCCDNSLTRASRVFFFCPPCHVMFQVREFIQGIGVENIGKRLINSREGKVRQPRRQALQQWNMRPFVFLFPGSVEFLFPGSVESSRPLLLQACASVSTLQSCSQQVRLRQQSQLSMHTLQLAVQVSVAAVSHNTLPALCRAVLCCAVSRSTLRSPACPWTS